MSSQSKMATNEPLTRTTAPREQPHLGRPLTNHEEQSDVYLARYYAHRAPEMEESFHLPCRAQDIAHLQEELPRMVDGLDLLEIACGTGYWTRFMAQRARSITATDVNEEMLSIARSKRYPENRVRHIQLDAWSLSELTGSFNAAVALFWWSHVPLSRARDFLREINRTLPPGSPVIFVDDLPEDGLRTPPVGYDEDGNSYQRRYLQDGDHFDIIKNYPTRRSLFKMLKGVGENPLYMAFDCLWLLRYHTPSP